MEDEHFRAKQLLLSMRDEQQERESYKAKTSSGQKSELVDLSLLVQKYKASLDGRCAAHAIAKQQHMSQTQERIIHKQTFPFDDPIFSIEPLEGVVLENKGEIAAHFALEPSQTLFGPKFSFSPKQGTVEPGEQRVIEISFSSDLLGQFSEEFRWNFKGTLEPVLLSFKGIVVGPTFHFKPDILDFQSIAYGFPASRSLRLYNTSHIPMSFQLRLDSAEDVARAADFRLTPESGTVPEMSFVEIDVFIQPRSIQTIAFEIIVDVEGVGRDMSRLALYAESVVPEISVVSPIVNLEDCFLCYSYHGQIGLVNNSNFPAKYELLPQEETARGVFTYTSQSFSGIIEPHSQRPIAIEVQIKRLGQVNFPVFIKIAGKESAPIAVDIAANGIGPNVRLSSSELNWGRIPVLQHTPLKLVLSNESPIMAFFNCVTLTEGSAFSVMPIQGVIQPGTSFEITVTAYLDDTLKFTDILKVSVQSDGVHEVQLVARGQGTTIVFAEGLRRVDFKDVFSNRDCSAEFVLANKGLRSQTIHWTREETRLAPNRDPSAPASQVFEAIPARFTLRPGAHQTVFIRGFSSEAAAVCEKLTCQAMIDKDPSRKTVVETIVTANFINPLIELTPNVLRFEKTHMSEEIFEVLEQSLVLRNTTTLALSLAFKCPPPFHVGIPTDGLCLGPQESIVVPVQYDSAYNASRISSREHAKLVISYQEHPQRDVVELFSEISFPNLTFSANTLKFGCVEADQEQRRMLTISNTSVLPVSYHWYFVNDPKAPSFGPVSQIFDIQPLRGELQPGEKQEVEVYFYGQVGRSFQIKALCDVAGGPKYEVALLGEASTVEFAFDKTTLSFGTMSYQSMAEQEIVLSNTGQVHFDYSVIVLPSVPLAAKIVVTPSQGSIPPKGRQRILVRFCPCVPEAVNDRFFIQIAHFEPTEIHIVGASVFPRMTIDIPRVADPKFDQYIGELARKRGMREADASEIEAEAERLVLVDKMREFVQKLADEVRQKLSLAEIQRAKFAGSVVLYHKGVVHKAAKEKRTMNLSESSHVRLSRFLCDFGTVIRNTTARRTFRIFNSGSHALSFAVDKTALTGTGFSVDPDKIKSLPHGEGIEFTAQLHARHHATDALEVDVPISITGGPTVLLSLRAAITVPEIKLSDDKIDFGEVLCGYRKTFFVHVHNPSAVACEWAALTFDEEGGTKKSKKRANPQPAREFDIVPRNGQLLPGEKSTFMVRFSPLDEKEYDITLPIKLSMNPKACMLHLLGRGIRPLITFEPDSIVVGPVLPHSDGVEARFWIQNHIKYPIEVFSIDFDQQFRDEEEILKQVQLSEAQPLFLPPREPGSALPEFIVDYAKRIAQHYGKAYINIDEIIEAAMPTVDASGSAIDHAMLRKDAASKEGRDARDQKDEDGGPHAYDLAEEACGNIPEEVIFEIIRQRLRREGRRGYVIDGLECKYIAPIPLLRMLLKMLTERGRRVAVFHIGLDLAKIREREVMVQRILADKELEALQIRELSEEDYDQLNDQDRAAYDLAMRKYKRRAKEIEDRRRAERRHLEEDVTNRSGERRVEEDKAKGRKVRKPVGGRPTGPEKLEKAPNTSKSDGKGGKVAKAPGSPKTARKAGDRADRSNDKEQRAADKSDRVNASNAEKEGGDDVVSRFGIAEDTFLNETTFRRAETYFGTLEVFMSIMKESDKSTASKAALPVAPNPIDKKPKAAKASGVAEQAAVGATALAAAALSAAAPGQVLDADGHASDEPAVLYFDIAANAMDEDAVFKAECEHIPHQEEESHAGTDRIAPPILEQIFVPPRDRSAASMTRFFSLLPPVPASEDEEAAAQDAVPQPLPAVPAIVTSPSPAPAASSKQDSSSKTPAADQNKGDPKKAKPAVKAPDEAKPPPPEPEEDTERVVQNKFRWIFQPGERKELTLRFNPTDVGRFEQILAFETAGARGRFQLPCVGTCQYHHIVTDFRKIFGKWRRQKDEKTVLHGEYVVSTGTYEFGPLLSSKPKEKYLERFPENRATFMMINPCNCEIKIMFALRNDVKGDVFFFEPQTMDLGPGQTQTVSVWAYPRNNNHFEDTFVVSVKDNPEPYTIKLGCIGVRPELEIDKKHISFDKMLLGRSERREIRLRNQTHMSVAWKLTGVESLGEEFSITPAEGMVESFQEVAVAAEFKGIKPIVVKRPIRLEVCDAEKIGGIVQDVSIMVTAEAYDIAMDLHFPKSSDGGLEFGVLRVFEEGKQMCMIKNKGKYEVGYRFMFDDPTIAEFFVVAPTQGVLQPSDKPFHVQITFKTTTEMTIKESSSLKCVVYEPTTGEVTASIPIKINARAVFSKFSVMPVRDLNFGALVHGTKAARQITIENLGEFDFKVSIYKLLTHIVEQKSGSKPRTTSRPGKPVRTAASPPAAKVAVNRKEVVKPTDTVSFGAFSLSPTSGTVAPGAKLVITVEFHAETPGSYEEIIGLDVSDRSPADGADVLEYRLVGESCVPGINTTDFVSIFEELSVCKRLELFNSQSNVYAEEDRVFYFGAYLAGQQVPVQFKISNPFKVACDIAFSTKPRSKSKSDSSDFAFDVEPKKLTIPSHEYKCITVTFHPTSIQSYAGLFEATVENVAEGRNRTLTFELRGEGTLPRVVVDRPTLKSKSGLPLLKFKRLLVGSSQTLPLVLRNDGIIQAKFKLEWAVKDNDDIDCPLVNIYHSLRPQEVRTVDIKCRPSAVRRLEGELRLKVLDNSFEDSSIQVFGEGYIDDITFESMPEDAENEIVFADCFIGESKQMTFRMRNHCQEWIRLAVSESADFTFSPAVAHIKPHNDREITVTFSPKQPCEIQHAPLVIRATKIRLVSPQDIEWDERMKIVRWVGADGTARGPATRKVLEHLAEPIFEGLAPPSEYTMLLSAFADFSQYECDTSSVHFKSTLMFQSRVFRFSLRNPGKVMLRFTFTICNEDGSPVDAADNVPFSVTPAVGAIQANETFMIALRFSPEDVGDYRYLVVCSMPNLAKDQKLLQIPVHGTSLRPLCHFELEESDYVASERRNPDRGVTDGVPAVLEPNTKVIEFSSCGVRSKNMNRFYIVNPTNLSYEFVWSQESPKDTKVFKCFTPRGIVAPNKKSEIMFEFSPETIDIKASFESLWTFTILEHGIRIPFLLVGQAIEPNVYADHTNVNFKSVLVGRQVKEVVHLTNGELVPFAFAFSDTSFELGQQGTPVLRFSPSSGTIGPNSEIPIEIVFSPASEKTFNFNLVCNIRKKPTPVTINIKGEGYEIHDSLQTEIADGNVFELAASPAPDNMLDFGQVQLNEKRVKRVYIINSGKFNFDYAWKFAGSKTASMITITPEIGTVPRGERIFCEIAFMPTSAAAVRGVRAVCHIVNGRSYPIAISGTGTKPLIRFSDLNIDFGAEFVFRPGMTAATHALQITNSDTRDISIDIVSPDVSWMEIQRGLNTLGPEETTVYTLSFFPREQTVYSTAIKFEVNGLSTVDVAVRGEGVEHRIEADQRQLNFGALRVGHSSVRTLKLANKSKLAAQFSIGPASTIETLLSYGVHLSMYEDLTLRPKAALSVDLKFAPHRRIPAFAEELFIEAPGVSRQLAVVSGACQGVEVRLENDTLPFGAVVQRSSTMRRMQLQNIGDIGVKFFWDSQQFLPDFSISPTEGYISPGMDIPLEITFHPSEIHPDIRYENLSCNIDGVQSIYLTLTGMCIPQPQQTDAVKFASAVRSPDTKSIQLTNKTSAVWHVRPIIENDVWSGPEVIEIEPSATKSYDLTFVPLETNGSGEGGRHEGSVFFPLPDGSGILYKLYGTADKPLSAGNISREIPCKTSFTEVLSVTNWLKRPQRFKVVNEVAKPDPSVIIKGNDFVDVPPLLSKDYKLTFYSYKEGLTNLRVVFRNESTQEYQFYNLAYKSTPPGIMGYYEMTTAVRQLVTRDIAIFNPLQTPATFSGSTSNPDASVSHSFTIQPRLHFKVGLGGSQIQTLRFTSYAKTRTDYTCKIDSTDFLIEKSVSAPAGKLIEPPPVGGVEISVDITYEPSKLGDTRTQLVVSSATGGEYICPLYGHSIAPRPQGPILIKSGSSSTLPFKNMFGSSATFNFVVDNPAFIVKSAETIAPKKTIQLTIGYKQPAAAGAASGGAGAGSSLTSQGQQAGASAAKANSSRVGKLTITHASSNMSWIYYLRHVA
nr:hypothetical protein HK105_006819 [Polyrhizophydium stewartii]